MAPTSDAATISNLPLEVLNHIFSYLPHNLGAIRLVCCKFNESCNVEKVSGNERILINENRRVEFFSSVRLLRNIFKLQVHSSTFDIDHVSFFDKFGGKLRSLTLIKCTAVPRLQFCENLKTLDLEHCSSTIVQSFRRSDGSFIRTNIVSLKIITTEDWSDETMNNFFGICPNLRSLTLQLHHFQPLSLAEHGFYSFENGEEGVFHRSDILSFNCIHHALSIRAAFIIELDLYASGILHEQVELIASISGLKLQKLTLTLQPNLTQKNIYNIVILQPELQSIAIRWCRLIQLNVLENWIEKCSKLTSLEIRLSSDDEFVSDGKFIDALASRSHLRELVLEGDEFSKIHLSCDPENNRRSFDHLRKLRLSNINCDCFLKNVSVNLKHLSLFTRNGISIETLELISDRFTNLETMEFPIYDPAVFVFCEKLSSQQMSLWNFKKLRALQILVATSSDYRWTTLLKPLQAPNLQFLELRGPFGVDAAALSRMVTNYPLVEFLVLSCSAFEMDPLLLRTVGAWKRLTRFYINNTECLKLHRGRDEEKLDLFLRYSGFVRFPTPIR